MKRRLTPLVMLAATIISLGVGCARPVTPTYSDPTKDIAVQRGEEFIIAINYDYRQAPDYFWYEEYDTTRLELVQSTCLLCRVGNPDQAILPGNGDYGTYSGGTVSSQLSRFRALQGSTTTVTMSYRDSPTAPPAEEQSFTVIVN